MGTPARTLFFGSGDFALPALARLADSSLVVLDSVVTAPARPAGRKRILTSTPVAEAAGRLGLAVRTPATLRDEAVFAEIRSIRPDLIVLSDYGRLIPGPVLDLPPHGALNLHPSLLPRHRGAAPVPAAILAGDEVTGVTLMRMDEGLDTGPTLARLEVALDGTETTPQLERRLAELGADLLVEHLPAWLDGSLLARPQAAEGATLTTPLRREDGRLDPDRPARELERRVRAYQPWPGAYLDIDGERLKVWAAGVIDGDAAPGALVTAGGPPALGTAAGLLRLDEVQPAGGRRMSGADYLRGRRR